MKEELIYTILDLEEWNRKTTCRFCSDSNNKSFCQIRTRNKVDGEIVENDMACENCKEKFENDELPKCEKCGRLKTKINFSVLSGKYICNCVRENESQEKELPLLPHQNGGMALFYETQINSLQEKLTTAEEAVEIEREEVAKFQEKSEEWGKRQKQELLDKIAKLEQENETYKEENKQLKKQNGIELYEKEIEELKKQLEQLSAQQQTAQIETPAKNGSIKGFFRFGGKK